MPFNPPSHFNPPSPVGFAPRRRRAFTLLQLLVSLGLITLLIGLSFSGWAAASKAAKKRETAAIIATLETALEEYRSQTGRMPIIPPAVRRDKQPDIDELREVTRQFVMELESVESSKRILQSIDRYYGPIGAFRDDAPAAVANIRSVFDSWNNEILLYYPVNGDQVLNSPAPEARWFWSVGPNGINDSQPDLSRNDTQPGFPTRGDDIPGSANAPS